jgi:quercetin dioxygenase-like cupin family protein
MRSRPKASVVALKSDLVDGSSDKHLSRRPELATSISQFDMHQEIRLLRNQESWQRETGRSSKTLVKQQDFRIVLVLMKAGTRLSEHRANARISIQTVLGRIRVHFRDQRHIELPAGGLLALDSSIPFDLECLEESAFLLTISWPKEYATWADDEAATSL